MMNIKVISFKRGLIWYACCEIPSEEHSEYYYDNTPFVTLKTPTVLSTIGLTYNSVNNKMLNKLRKYFNERKNDYGHR